MGTLPDSVKSIFHRMDYGALPSADDRDQVNVFIKLPYQTAQSLERPLPVRHFLFMVPTPRAPVVVWFFEIMDNPQDPLRIDTYLNIMNRVQARNLERLIRQKIVPMHFVNGVDLSIVITQGVLSPPNASVVFRDAMAHAGRIPQDQYDFDTAKLIFQCAYSLDEIATWQRSLPEP